MHYFPNFDVGLIPDFANKRFTVEDYFSVHKPYLDGQFLEGSFPNLGIVGINTFNAGSIVHESWSYTHYHIVCANAQIIRLDYSNPLSTLSLTLPNSGDCRKWRNAGWGFSGDVVSAGSLTAFGRQFCIDDYDNGNEVWFIFPRGAQLSASGGISLSYGQKAIFVFCKNIESVLGDSSSGCLLSTWDGRYRYGYVHSNFLMNLNGQEGEFDPNTVEYLYPPNYYSTVYIDPDDSGKCYFAGTSNGYMFNYQRFSDNPAMACAVIPPHPHLHCVYFPNTQYGLFGQNDDAILDFHIPNQVVQISGKVFAPVNGGYIDISADFLTVVNS